MIHANYAILHSYQKKSDLYIWAWKDVHGIKWWGGGGGEAKYRVTCIPQSHMHFFLNYVTRYEVFKDFLFIYLIYQVVSECT